MKLKSLNSTNITIPPQAWEHFWHEPAPGSMEFWAYRFKPKCNPGDLINFRYNGKVIATATVHQIEPPGTDSCATTGNFKNRWKVYWKPETFKDLRQV